jgi:hypothetical protein
MFSTGTEWTIMAKEPVHKDQQGGGTADPVADELAVALIVDDAAIGGDDLDVIVLSVDDLSPDANNEVVVSGVEGLSITILAEQAVADEGISAAHTTVTGIDVVGLEYVSFSSGLKVFYDRDSVQVKK